MPTPTERRLFPRYPGSDLRVEIGGRQFDVSDISLVAVRVKGLTMARGEAVTFFLYPAGGGARVQATGRLIARYPDAVALRFDCPTMALMKLVVWQAGLKLGVEPYLVK